MVLIFFLTFYSDQLFVFVFSVCACQRAMCSERTEMTHKALGKKANIQIILYFYFDMGQCTIKAFFCPTKYLLSCLLSWNNWGSRTPTHTWTYTAISEFQHRQRQGAPSFWRLFSFHRHNHHRNAPLRRRGQNVFKIKMWEPQRKTTGCEK